MHYYIDALKKYSVFEGRANRTEFWMFELFYVLFALLGAIIFGFIGILLGGINLSGYFLLAYLVLMILPHLGITIRRLRDAGRNWGWILLPVIPFVGIVILIILLCQPTKALDTTTVSYTA